MITTVAVADIAVADSHGQPTTKIATKIALLCYLLTIFNFYFSPFRNMSPHSSNRRQRLQRNSVTSTANGCNNTCKHASSSLDSMYFNHNDCTINCQYCTPQNVVHDRDNEHLLPPHQTCTVTLCVAMTYSPNSPNNPTLPTNTIHMPTFLYPEQHRIPLLPTPPPLCIATIATIATAAPLPCHIHHY